MRRGRVVLSAWYIVPGAWLLAGAFEQNGGTLIVDLGQLNGAAALAGEGKAELKIESGNLELIGDTATPEGNAYTIAS